MGGFGSRSAKKESDTLFGREKWKEQKREEKRKKALNPNLKRAGVRDVPLVGLMAAQAQQVAGAVGAVVGGSGGGGAAAGVAPRGYDEEALERMRRQLDHDADAFLLNNILLAVQFFENYDREAYQMKSVPIGEYEHRMDEAMVLHHKHAFFADRLQECVREHVRYARRGRPEPLGTPRLYVIYDNVEASEPGDTSDYSAVLDAPFYKLQVENSKEPGYVKLRKLEVLESTVTNKEDNVSKVKKSTSSSSVRSSVTDSERESDDSEEVAPLSKGRALLDEIKMRMKEPPRDAFARVNDTIVEENITVESERRSSGPIKYIKPVAARGNLSNIKKLHKTNVPLEEDSERKITADASSPLPHKKEPERYSAESRTKKSIMKNGTARKLSGPSRELRHETKLSDFKGNFNGSDNFGYDTGTSGYRSASSGRQNESSETESDYGYSTITDLSTPKPVEVSVRSNLCKNSGVLPDECWNAVQVKATNYWSDEDEEDDAKTESSDSAVKSLYETYFFLSSKSFMTNFVDNFIIKLGPDLGLSPSIISSALTQGASIYCDFVRNGGKVGYEVIPALIASWPNIANPWVIRERRIIQNPRTNFNYQWPTKYMVSKTIDFGCLLIPFGFRPKRGVNSDVELQWKIIFPAAERYLESRLAHSHIRCYLFALALHKTFMENETAKMGVDASHIKNHLFWECEDNYAKWPEDRLGETLRLFLKRFYAHFSQARFPNYFVDSCNDFKGIPKPLLLKTQRRLLDILETPVMHVLCALQKLKYTSKDFYPQFDYYQLYQILTCKNPLRILNPNLPIISVSNLSSESEDDHTDDTLKFWDQEKVQDKQYLWKKAKQRQSQETQRRKAIAQAKKQTKAAALEKNIDRNIALPKKLEPEKRRLVLELFIPHFIAMARYSDKFEATKQAIIYAEQAQRLCMLLLQEPAGEIAANDFLDTIRERLSDYQRKLVHHGGYKLLSKRDSRRLSGVQPPTTPSQPMRRQRPRSLNNIIAQDSPTDVSSAPAFTFADVHGESSGAGRNRANSVDLSVNSRNPESERDEESQL